MYSSVNDQLIFLKFEKSNRDTLILRFTIHLWDSSSDRQQRSMGSYLYKHTDGDQIHLHTLHRYIYIHQNLEQIKFLIQCSARPLLLHTILCCISINQCSQYEKTCVHCFIQCCRCSEMHLVIQLCSIFCSSFLIWSSEYS